MCDSDEPASGAKAVGALMASLEELRREYDQVGVGPRLHELLERVVWSTVRQYPASAYSAYGNWDRMACEDVLNDWVLHRLWGRADLCAMLSSATTVSQFRASLTTSLRQHLTNRRRRSITSNLYSRASRILKGDAAFRAVDGGGAEVQRRWTLAESTRNEPSALSMRELLGIANQLNDEELEVVRYGPFSQKLSPILREPDLRQFLAHMLGCAEGSLSLHTILDVMRLRFSLPTEEHIELDELMPTSTPSAAEGAFIILAAESVVARLAREEVQLLESYFQAGGAFRNAASLAGCSPDQLRAVVHRVLGMVSEASDSLDDAHAVLHAIESLLLERSG